MAVDFIDRVNDKLHNQNLPPLLKAFTSKQVEELGEQGVIPMDSSAYKYAQDQVRTNSKDWRSFDPNLLRVATKPVVGYHKASEVDAGRYIIAGPETTPLSDINNAFIVVAKQEMVEVEKRAKEGIKTEKNMEEFAGNISGVLVMVDSVAHNSGRFGKKSELTEAQQKDLKGMLTTLDAEVRKVPANIGAYENMVNRDSLLKQIADTKETLGITIGVQQYGRGFSRFDTNKNHLLDAAELPALMAAARKGPLQESDVDFNRDYRRGPEDVAPGAKNLIEQLAKQPDAKPFLGNFRNNLGDEGYNGRALQIPAPPKPKSKPGVIPQ